MKKILLLITSFLFVFMLAFANLSVNAEETTEIDYSDSKYFSNTADTLMNNYILYDEIVETKEAGDFYYDTPFIEDNGEYYYYLSSDYDLSRKMYCDYCLEKGYVLNSYLEFDSVSYYFDNYPLRTGSLDNYISFTNGECKYINSFGSDVENITGNFEMGYFVSKHQIGQYLYNFDYDGYTECGSDIFSYEDEFSIDRKCMYKTYTTMYGEYSGNSYCPVSTIKVNSNLTENFIFENCFYVCSSYNAVIKLSIDAADTKQTSTRLVVLNGGYNYDSEDGSYNYDGGVVDINYECKTIYIPITANTPVLFGFEHKNHTASIYDISVYSALDGEKAISYEYTSGATTYELFRLAYGMSDERIIENTIYYYSNIRKNYGYNNGFTAGQEYGESLHADDYSNGYQIGYDEGYAAGKEDWYDEGIRIGWNQGYAAAEDTAYKEGYVLGNSEGYDSGYIAGQEYGESLHASDYSNGLSVGYGNGYQAGYDDAYSISAKDIYDDAFDEGYNAGYVIGYDDAISDTDTTPSNYNLSELGALLLIFPIALIVFIVLIFINVKRRY